MQPIQMLPHDLINKEKWDAAIDRSVNGMIYANSWYLDCMSPQWSALVHGDYEAVMPITWRSKMGIRYVCQPAFAQQLGMFYSKADHKNLLPDFLKQVALQFKLAEIFLNYDNATTGTMAANNFVLSLKGNYEEIHEHYKPDLLKNLKRTEKFNMIYQADTDVEAAVNAYQSSYQQRMGARPQDYILFRECVEVMMHKGNAFIRKVSLPSGEILAVGIFAKDARRIYNLASTTFPNGRTFEANHFLFDQLIKEFSGSGLLLDFEGSDQPGIARFYQKFGSINEPYYFWKINRLPAILRWWKR